MPFRHLYVGQLRWLILLSQAETLVDDLALVIEQKREAGLLLGRYEILRELGEGSSGMVYACRDHLLCNWIVAMKIFPRSLLAEQDALDSLQREVAALQFLHHEHVAKFYEFIACKEFVGFTMEHLDGGSITDSSEPGYALNIRETVIRLLQAGAGLQAIHGAGMVHRDLKPQNILRTSKGIVKIVDFGVMMPAPNLSNPKDTVSMGIYTLNEDLRRHVRDGGTISGTFDYISPEQLQASVVDCRSDLYSLGVVAYEMITGAVPFADVEMPKFLWKKIQEDPPPPHQLRRSCPKLLSNAIMRALERDPNKRYQTSSEFVADLWEVMQFLERQEAKRKGPNGTSFGHESLSTGMWARFSIRRLLEAVMITIFVCAILFVAIIFVRADYNTAQLRVRLEQAGQLIFGDR